MTSGSSSAPARANVTGFRMTRQREAVWSALEGSGEFQSAQDLHRHLVDRGERVGLATIYRTLQSMGEDGLVDILHTGGGETVYRRCREDAHHHHLVCRSCGATVELAAPRVEAWASKVAAEHGYTDLTHTLEIFGLCATCSKEAGTRKQG
jgi:Fur family ferric uptake transcriptional regulator